MLAIIVGQLGINVLCPDGSNDCPYQNVITNVSAFIQSMTFLLVISFCWQSIYFSLHNAQVPHMSMTVWPKDVDINSIGSFFVFPFFGSFSFSAVCIPSFASSKQYSHFFCRVSFGKVSYFFLVKPRIFCWSNLFASVKPTICCLYPKCWFDQGLTLIFASLNLLSAGVTLILPGFTPNFVGFLTLRSQGAGVEQAGDSAHTAPPSRGAGLRKGFFLNKNGVQEDHLKEQICCIFQTRFCWVPLFHLKFMEV